LRQGSSLTAIPAPEEQGKDPAAVALGKKGGKARATALSSEKRREIALRAASPHP
jgi:hypothetical protein